MNRAELLWPRLPEIISLWRGLLCVNGIAVLTVGLLYLAYLAWQTNDELQRAQANETTLLALVSDDLRNRLSTLQEDALILAGSQQVETFLDKPDAASRVALERHFVTTLRHRQLYGQLRLLDPTGQELIRVQRHGQMLEVVKQDALQDKRDRYYVAAASQLTPGQTLLTPLDLNVEQGRIEEPLNPTLRVVAPAVSPQGHRALLVINYRAQYLLADFAGHMARVRGEAMLVDQYGFWLHHPDPALTFGAQRGHGHSLAGEYPQAWTGLQAGRTELLKTTDGWFIIGYLSLDGQTLTPHWYIVSRLPPPVFLRAWMGRLRGGVVALIPLLALTILATSGLTVVRVLNRLNRQQARQLDEQRLRQTRASLQHSEARLRIALRSAPLTVYQQDRALRYTWVANLSERDIFPARVGKRDGDLLGSAQAEQLDSLKQRVLDTGEGVRDELSLDLAGQHYWFQVSVEPLLDDQQQVIGITGAVFDITTFREQEARLIYQANFDALTDLPNRSLLQDRLIQVLRQARRQQGGVVVMVLDIHRFKRINLSLGFAGGDLLLCAVAGILRSACRAEDTVARLGGNQFALVLQAPAQLDAISSIAAKLLAQLARPQQLLGQEVVISANLGISVYPRDGDNADALLRHAEIALQLVRSTGQQGAFHFYDEPLNARHHERLKLELALRRALAGEGALQLHYQPQLDLRSQRIVAVEALARWQDLEFGAVPPSVFIPLAEDCGLIHALGIWVLREACSQQRRWELAGLSLGMAVNLSVRQLGAADFIEQVRGVLEDTGVQPHQLELEITETLLMEDLSAFRGVLEQLRGMGVRLAVDDFGTGYSSLGYLRGLPVDVLKIDRSFIEDICEVADSMAIVLAIIAMAHALRLKVVAEGVEEVNQADLLEERGCDYLQGYWLARPLPATEIPALV